MNKNSCKNSCIDLHEFILDKIYANPDKYPNGMIPIAQIRDEFISSDVLSMINRLRLLGIVQLVTVKSGLAKAIGIELVQISCRKYGFIHLSSRCEGYDRYNACFLLKFIKQNFSEYASKNLNCIPICLIFRECQKTYPGFEKERFTKSLKLLRIFNCLELRTTATMKAFNLGIDLYTIDKVNYGFIKLLSYNFPVIAIR